MAPTVTRDVVPGVHRIEHAHTNCYLVVEDDTVTVVDACFPATLAAVDRCLADLGLDRSALWAVVLTHGHFDHVGFARTLQRDGVPVWVHAADRDLAAHPYRYRPRRNRVGWLVSHPGGWRPIAAMAGAGALRVVGPAADRELQDGRVVPVPGRPTVIHLPGHTDGQVALHLSDRGALLTGDALVTFDPYTGRRGPQLVAPAATADPVLARASLQQLRGLGELTLLPGHGDPWTGPVDVAVTAAVSRR